jgi:hypothetical protein
MTEQFAQVQDLRRTITDEIFKAIGLSESSWARRLFWPAVWLPAQRFAQLSAQYDRFTVESGFCNAARLILPRFVKSVEASGVENIPSEGPLLIASNHPGAYDGFVLLSNLHRNDVKMVVSGVPFFRNMAATASHLIYTSADTHERMGVVRAILRHLKEGGALIIFPSGGVDPDPDQMEGASEELEAWSPSLDLILRKVPTTNIVVTIVSGILSPRSLKNPLTRVRKGRRDRQRVAEFIQVMQQLIWGKDYSLTPRVTFGKPILASDLIRDDNATGIMGQIIENARQVLNTHIASGTRHPGLA